METVKEFYEAIKGQLAERLANPFTGAFCIAWVIWNLRLLIVIAGKGTYQEKFAYIDISLYPHWGYWVLRGFTIPLITAAVYLWAYPRATRWLAEDYRKQQTKANNLMKAAAGEALLSVEESLALRTRFAEAEQAWKTDRARINGEVDGERAASAVLAKTNEELRAEIAQLRSSLVPPGRSGGTDLVFSEPVQQAGPSRFRLPLDLRSVLGNELVGETYTTAQLRILSWLREGRAADVSTIINNLKIDKFEVARAIDRLTDLELLALNRDDEHFISAKGRAVLGAFVDNNLWDFSKQGA
ncbi:helix-turn-helix domain-containing protein [Variovorax sp. CCNWLW186]|uniref:MarR family transcriptional regulator n=1 Tax=Variovorax sp. CCNWLW186 TaxID=3127473 RepID=UPI003076EEE7